MSKRLKSIYYAAPFMKTHGTDLGWVTNYDYPFLEGRWRGKSKTKKKERDAREIERMKEMKRKKKKADK